MKTLKDYIVNENNFFKNLGVGQETLIRKWLDEHEIKNYKINDDLTIDVNGDVDFLILDNHVEYLPEYIQFNNVDGNFRISSINLKSLRGCPKNISYPGGFSCSGCPELTSLEGCPKDVCFFMCVGCKKIKSLEGCPKYSLHNFNCSDCESLTSLKGCPEDVKFFKCNNCKKLTSLKGCPKNSEDFSCKNIGKKYTKDEVKQLCHVSSAFIWL
jgi:hypothetical protein